MNKPNKKYSISLTAAEWDMIARAVQSGEFEVQLFIEEVDGRDVDAKLKKLSEAIGKFVSQLKIE
tara:strand:- start:36 stop:230 length:195 start_codon:yes stop_codon:yes gene_type:complete